MGVHISLAINPQKEYTIRPEQFQIHYKEIKLATPDNYQLNIWLMDPPKEKDNGIAVIICRK